MKKAIVLVVFAVLLLSGCDAFPNGGTAELPDFLSGTYVFTADYAADGINGELEFKKSGVEQCELTFLSPDAVKGVNLQIKDGNVSTELMGISYECPITLLANEYPIVLIYNVLSGTGEKPVSVNVDKDTGYVTYEFEDGTKLVADDDAPVSIEIPSISVVLTVTSFERLKAAE